MPKGHNDYVATPQLNQFGAAYTPLDETNYSGAQSAGANVFGGGINQSNATNAQQGQLAQMLFNQAQGQGPSLAQGQLQNALGAGQAQAAGAIASQRGLNPALAARLIGNQQNAQAMNAANQSAQTRIQEQQNAYNQLGGLLNAQRGAQLQQAGLGGNLFSQVGNLQNAQNATRLQNSLGTQGMNLQAALANQNALMGAQSINAGVSQANTNAQNAVTGNVLNATGAVVGGVLGGPLGAAAGSRAGNITGGGNISQNVDSAAWTGGRIGYAHGGAIPASPSGHMPEERPSFAEMVAHHIVRLDGIQHLAKGGKVKPIRSSEDQPMSAIFANEDQADLSALDDTPKPKPQKLGDGGGVLTPYQQAIASGMTPDQAYKNLSNNDKLNLTNETGGNWFDYAFNPDNTERKAVSMNADPNNPGLVAGGLPASNKQQNYDPGVHEFNPGNFGGLATDYMNHDTGGTPNQGFGFGGLGQAFLQGAQQHVAGRTGGNLFGGLLGGQQPAVSMAPQGAVNPGRTLRSQGGPVPGQAVVDGDSPKNDNVHVMLSPGEIVIPRSASKSKKKAKKFIDNMVGDEGED